MTYSATKTRQQANMTTYQQETNQIIMKAMQTARLDRLKAEGASWESLPEELKDRIINDYNERMFSWLISLPCCVEKPLPRRSERLAKKNKK